MQKPNQFSNTKVRARLQKRNYTVSYRKSSDVLSLDVLKAVNIATESLVFCSIHTVTASEAFLDRRVFAVSVMGVRAYSDQSLCTRILTEHIRTY